MKLYYIWQDEVGGYDTYDSMVVLAESEEQARLIDPSSFDKSQVRFLTKDDTFSCNWVGISEIHKLHVQFLADVGETLETDPRVICASFNAG